MTNTRPHIWQRMSCKLRGLLPGLIVALVVLAALSVSLYRIEVETVQPNTSVSPQLRPTTGVPTTATKVARWPETFAFRQQNGDIDCQRVFRALGRLYEESRARRAAWHAAGYNLTVKDYRGRRVDEIHILSVGDSWGYRFGRSISRHLDVCRMLSPHKLIKRDECSLQFMPLQDGHSVYQLSRPALHLTLVTKSDEADYIRVHIHRQLTQYLDESARHLENLLLGPWPTPSITALTFPVQAQCRRFLNESIEGLENQMPTCLCQDTVDFEKEGARRVPIDAVMLFASMWDTQRPTVENDGFTFEDGHTDWYVRQARFHPNRSEHPYITWEENVERLRRFLTNGYAKTTRQTIASAADSAPRGLPMPFVLLARGPNVNCSAPKFTDVATRTSRTQCEELALPVQDAIDDALRAAYGEPLLGLPAVDSPDWLRLVNYRPLTATVSPKYQYNYAGQPIAPGEYLCTMSDGTHLDTSIWSPDESPHVLWCAKHVHRLFWEEVLR